MVISALKTFSHKSIPPSTFSKACPKVISRAFSFLTTHQAIRNEPQMHYQHGKCQKVCPFRLYFYFLSLSFIQGRGKAGHTIEVGRACDTDISQVGMFSCSTFRTTTPPCPGGSKGWSKSSRSVVCGRRGGSMRSVQISAAPLDIPIAVVDDSSSRSRTSPIRNHNFKNSLSHAAMSVISTQSTIAS
jgi:hypothetical protein